MSDHDNAYALRLFEPVTIFRVELEDDPRYGLYSSNVSNELQELTGRHIRPSDDSGLNGYWQFQDDVYFGFGSIAQLKAWIYRDDWRESLHAEGYHISVFEAQGRIGNTQAIFQWNTRKEGHSLSLLEI